MQQQWSPLCATRAHDTLRRLPRLRVRQRRQLLLRTMQLACPNSELILVRYYLSLPFLPFEPTLNCFFMEIYFIYLAMHLVRSF